MKKLLCIILAMVMLLSLAACGADDKKTDTPAGKTTPAGTTPAGDKADEGNDNPGGSDPGSVEKAVDGTLKLSTANLAIDINGTAVAMPYAMTDIIAAGVSVDEYIQQIELSAGDYFTPNLFVDADWNYGISPNYYNGSDKTVSITEAKAESIGMFTYEEAPKDQNISILGIKFGMTKAEVISLLGEPMWNEADEFQWLVSVSDGNWEGNFIVTFASEAEDATVSEVNLSVHEPW